METDITLDELDKYCDLTRASIDPIEITDRFNTLLNYYKCTALDFKRGSTFWRARDLGTRDLFKNISELSYPPKNLVKQGRINNKNKPVLYLASRKETALSEINIKENEFVQLAGFRIFSDKGMSIAIVGIFWSVFKTGSIPLIGKDPDGAVLRYINNLPTDESLKLIYIDRFLATILSDRKASENDYLHTNILSKIILDKTNSESIAYPSVKDEGGFNLAVKAEVSDSLFENVSCSVLQINRKIRYGIYISKTIHIAQDVDTLGDFIWKELLDSEGRLNGFHSIFYNQKDDKDDVMNRRYLSIDTL